MQLIEPKVKPPLDDRFPPAVLANQNFQRKVKPVGVRAVIGLERGEGEISRYETTAPISNGRSAATAIPPTP